MANIPIRDISTTGIPTASSFMVFDDGTSMRRAEFGDAADAIRPIASESEAVAAAENTKISTPLRVKQYVDAQAGVTLATKAQGDLANTAVQPGDLGALAVKDKVGIADLDTTGTANTVTWLRGDGTWATPSGGGDMSTVFYDSDGFTSDAFGGRVPFATVAAADAAVVGAAPAQIVTPFFDTDAVPGSGVEFKNGGTSDPSSPGQIDITANGVNTFYTRSNLVLRPEQFGCKNGGTPSVNRAALLQMFALADVTGREIDFGTSNKVFVIPTGISYTWQHNKPIIRGSGATIKLDKAGGAVSSAALLFNYDQLGFDIEGLTVDGNFDCPYVLSLINTNTSALNESTIRDGRIVGVSTKNAYTRTSSEGGTRGIQIIGWLRHLYAENISAEEMKIATGAYNANYSTSGIEISRNSAGAYPLYKDIIAPYVNRVYSEDMTQTQNIDAVLLFDAIPSGNAIPQGSTSVQGGMIRNSWGRGVKFQAVNIEVNGLFGEINEAPTGGQTICFLDFQFGNGRVSGGGIRCSNNCGPTNVILSQGQTYASGSVNVDGFRYIARGTVPTPESLVWYNPVSNAAQGEGVVVRNCASHLAPIKNILRLSTSGSVAAPIERASVTGNAVNVVTAGVSFEFANATQQMAATFSDNFNTSTSSGVPLYRRLSGGSPVSYTVGFVGTTTNNWYFDAGV